MTAPEPPDACDFGCWELSKVFNKAMSSTMSAVSYLQSKARDAFSKLCVLGRDRSQAIRPHHQCLREPKVPIDRHPWGVDLVAAAMVAVVRAITPVVVALEEVVTMVVVVAVMVDIVPLPLNPAMAFTAQAPR